MSGFDQMTSEYSRFLHPPVNAKDTYDPTFLEVTRKRRTNAPQSEVFVEEKGKRIDVSKQVHDPQRLLQLDTQHREETFTGETRSTRFGAGFSRRREDVIGSNLQRKRDEEDRKLLHDRCSRERRTVIAARASHNPITGGNSIASTYFETPQETGKTVRTKKLVTSQWESTLFKEAPAVLPNRRTQRQVPPPTTKSKKKNEVPWSVGQQMQCYDGFVLPPI